MAIDDHSPEGRNLTLASVGFFIFYAAGGYFDKGEVSLNVVNMHFRNYELMGWSAWVMLFWFAFRYWVETKSSVVREVADYLPDYLSKSKYARRYMEGRVGPLPQGAHTWDLSRVRVDLDAPYSRRFRLTASAATGQGDQRKHMIGHGKVIPLEGPAGIFIPCLAIGAIILNRPLVTRMAIPWALFFLALVSATYVTLLEPYSAPVFIEK